jgi:hypothetical protein
VVLTGPGGAHALKIRLGHQRLQDQIVVVAGIVALAQLFDAWLFRRLGEDVLGARRGHDSVEDARLYRRDGLAVVAGGVLDDFVRHHAVALAGDDVEHRLDADQLAEGRGHAGIAEFSAHDGGFLEYFLELVRHVVLGELRAQRADHAARDLVIDRQHVVLGELVDEIAGRMADLLEMISDGL